MIIRRARRYTVQMAPYESYSFGADVEMSHHDLGISDAKLTAIHDTNREALRDELTKRVLEELNSQLHDEIHDAAELTTNDKSFLLTAFGIKKTKPRRR